MSTRMALRAFGLASVAALIGGLMVVAPPSTEPASATPYPATTIDWGPWNTASYPVYVSVGTPETGYVPMPYYYPGTRVRAGFDRNADGSARHAGEVTYLSYQAKGVVNLAAAFDLVMDTSLANDTDTSVSADTPIKCYDTNLATGVDTDITAAKCQQAGLYQQNAIKSVATNLNLTSDSVVGFYAQTPETISIPEDHLITIRVPVVVHHAKDGRTSASQFGAFAFAAAYGPDPYVLAPHHLVIDPPVATAPTIGAVASAPMSTTATLSATIYNQWQTAGSVYFDWGSDSSYGASSTAIPLVNAQSTQASFAASPLAPVTTYHWRVRIVRTGQPDETSGDRTFTTLATGGWTIAPLPIWVPIMYTYTPPVLTPLTALPVVSTPITQDAPPAAVPPVAADPPASAPPASAPEAVVPAVGGVTTGGGATPGAAAPGAATPGAVTTHGVATPGSATPGAVAFTKGMKIAVPDQLRGFKKVASKSKKICQVKGSKPATAVIVAKKPGKCRITGSGAKVKPKSLSITLQVS